MASALAMHAPGVSAAPAPVKARLLSADLVTPRERPVVRVRLSARDDTSVRLRLVAGGRTLGRSRELLLRPGRARTTRLRLGSAGRRLLGRCATARVTLVVQPADAASLRTRGKTTRDPVRCAPLNWPPPVLENPETVELGQGYRKIALEADRDYILRLPRGRKLGGTWVIGGRNIVLIGGHVTIPRATAGDEERRALYFKNQTGTVHVEGVLIDAETGAEGDAIVVGAPAAAVQIQNVRVAGLWGSDEGIHADVLQPWGGVRALRVDRLTGTSHFQGLIMPVELAPIGSASIRFANLRALTPSDRALAERRTGGHMVWLTKPGSCSGYPLALEQVYVTARPGRTLATSVWPQPGDGSRCSAVAGGGAVRWPGLPVRGEVRGGAPKGGDYVPRLSVGERYRSPGYAAETIPEPAPRSVSVFVRGLQAVACRFAALDCGG